MNSIQLTRQGFTDTDSRVRWLGRTTPGSNQRINLHSISTLWHIHVAIDMIRTNVFMMRFMILKLKKFILIDLFSWDNKHFFNAFGCSLAPSLENIIAWFSPNLSYRRTKSSWIMCCRSWYYMILTNGTVSSSSRAWYNIVSGIK